MSEIWRDILGYEGRYEVSNLGRIRTVGRIVPYGRWRADGTKVIGTKERTISVDPYGYSFVTLTAVDGKMRIVKIHKAVLEAFVSPRPKGMQGCHDDNNRQNNVLSNLRWDTPKGNNADKRKHGTAQIGSKNPGSKLDETSVGRIKALLGTRSMSSIAREYGVSVTTIHYIKKGRLWAHIPSDFDI